MRGPLPRYKSLVATGALAPDPAQEDVAAHLQALSDALTASKRDAFSLFKPKQAPAKGVYLWGAVGRGKSLLMDIFFNNTNLARKRRAHFHEFMAETHERIAAWRAADDKTRRRRSKGGDAASDDPIPLVAADIAENARLLCLDEFQVTDIADAMILGRLFEALFAEGVTIVATSNRRPDDLYKDGLNRQLFLPFIAQLKSRLDVVALDAARDYRLDRLGHAPVYYAPLGPEADAALDRAWKAMIAGAQEKSETLTVKGRSVIAPRSARGIARFEFSALCEQPLGASDYLAIVRRYSALFIEHIPLLGPEKRDAAKRFIVLIDAVYDTRTKLVCSAAAAADALCRRGDGALEFERTASRLIEMQSADYLGAEHEMLAE